MSKYITFFILPVFLLISVSLLRGAEQCEIQISYGRWSISPFTTLLEKESEDLVKEGLKQLVDPLLPRYTQSIIQSNIDFSSSGQFVFLNFWYNFKNTRFSLGLRGNYIDLSLPYTMLSQQSIDFLNFPVVNLKLLGNGEINLRSGTVSFLGRLKLLSASNFRWWFYGGVVIFFYEGDIEIQQQVVLETPVGDLTYSGSFDHTIKDMRELSDDIPAVLFSPEFGTQIQYGFHKNLGLILDVSLSQGTFFSGGVYFKF